ncbi:MAG: hypothetical protein VKP62_09785 [Candidatus Sericytochromatia bacterium]|nr:hypothetical protein [Candidatus Sericytochromatia bacterium]
MRFILKDELNGFPPEAVAAELARLGLTYVSLLDRISEVLAAKPLLWFQEVARCIPAFWSTCIKDKYPPAVQAVLLSTLQAPSEESLPEWERLAPYVLKKAATVAAETLIHERTPWVLAVLNNWATMPEPAVERIEPADDKFPVLGSVLEGLGYLNKVQLLAVEAAQKEARSRGEHIAFGSLCVRKGWLTAAQLKSALELQADIAVSREAPKRLGLYLLEVGVITPQDLSKALVVQRQTGCSLGDYLVQQGLLTREFLETVLVLQRQDRIAGYFGE